MGVWCGVLDLGGFCPFLGTWFCRIRGVFLPDYRTFWILPFWGWFFLLFSSSFYLIFLRSLPECWLEFGHGFSLYWDKHFLSLCIVLGLLSDIQSWGFPLHCLMVEKNRF